METQTLLPPLEILHLEDSIADHRLVCRTLDQSSLNYSICRVDSLEEFVHCIERKFFDIVLADYRLPGFTAIDAWETMGSLERRPPFVLVSGAIGESAAVSAIHLGISDYIHKEDIHRLERAILKSIEIHKIRAESEKAARELTASEKRLSEFTEYLQSAIEHERAAIARDIHDDIGGSLAAAKLDLAWISRHSTDARTQSHIQAATEMLQHALGASQRIMMNLRPSILDQGLVAAVQWLASSFERRTGIRTILRTNRDNICPEKSIQLTAYRTAQEALTNVSKYANCSLVHIDISDAEGFLTVEISDNGIGIEDIALKKKTAFGIRGLHERAKAVGGWLDISTKRHEGTSIILSIPLIDGENQPVEDHRK